MISQSPSWKMKCDGPACMVEASKGKAFGWTMIIDKKEVRSLFQAKHFCPTCTKVRAREIQLRNK